MNDSQSSNAVLMVRPARFGFNPDAARSNAFARQPAVPDVVADAVREFDALAGQLSSFGIELLILEDSHEPMKPDAVFPNNWVSFHGDGTVVLYPMATEARQLERDPDRLLGLLHGRGFHVSRIVDLTGHERAGRFLEGTGSLILDRPHRRAFASLAPRTHHAVIAEFDEALGYSTLVFEAHDASGWPIYHTNVMMSLGERFAVLCVAAVAPEHRGALLHEIETSGRAAIDVNFEQMHDFACNIIELRSGSGEPVIALSAAALRSFRPDQRRMLERMGGLAVADIPTIEAVGGGSVRCMIADVHLPRREEPSSNPLP